MAQPTRIAVAVPHAYTTFSRKEKKVIKSTSIRIIFFLYWLTFATSEESGKFKKSQAGIPYDNWEEALGLFHQVTGLDLEEKGFIYPENEHYRIMSRYNKKANIRDLIELKNLGNCIAYGNTSSFHIEIKCMLYSIEKYYKNFKHECAQEGFTLNQTRSIGYMLIREAVRIFFFIANTHLEDCKDLKYREIQRRFKVDQKTLKIILDYLEHKRIIYWDQENKLVSLSADWKQQFWDFFERLDIMHNQIRDSRQARRVKQPIKPIQVDVSKSLKESLSQ